MGNAKIILLVIIVAAFTVNAAGAEPDEACSLRLRLRTTSDWTLVSVLGLGDIKLWNATTQSSYITYTMNGDSLAIWVGKPQYDETLTDVTLDIVTVNPSNITVNISKGYIGVTSLKVSAWTGEWYRTITCINHRNTPEDEAYNHYTETINEETIEKYSVDIITPKEPDREVLAVYYPWFGSPDDSGVGRHWGIVSEGDIEESLDYPLLGAYDSQSASLIEQHIKQASAKGVTCFVVSWWGINGYEDQAFEKILQQCDEFKACVYYESNRGYPRNSDEVADELNHIITRYGECGGYLKYQGKPVIFVFNAEGENRDTVFWKQIKEQLLDCVLVADFRNPELLELFDGVHIYNELDIETHRAVTEWISSQNIFFPETIQDFNGKSRYGYIICGNRITVGTVSPGYDDTKIRPTGVSVPRLGNETYQSYWTNILDYPLDWVLITSWNEWHEGTEIEQSRENGYDALRYTKYMVDEWLQR